MAEECTFHPRGNCACLSDEEEAPVEELVEVEEVEENTLCDECGEDPCACEDDEDLEAYLEELPVKELKKLCEEADLSKKGKKADLVARLLE